MAWDSFSAENYPKFLFRWNEHAINKHGSIAVTKENAPECAKGDSREKLCNYWMSEEFEKASSLCKSNRAAGTVIPHTSGNLPYVILAANKETYAAKLREKHEKVDRLVNELEDEGLQVYKEIVGCVKKGHLLGRSREKWSARKRAPLPPQFETQENSKEVKKLKLLIAKKDKKINKLSDVVALLCRKVGIEFSLYELEDDEPDDDSVQHETSNIESNGEDDEEDGSP